MGGKGLKLRKMHLGVNCKQLFAERFTPKCILGEIFNFHEKTRVFFYFKPSWHNLIIYISLSV